VSALVAVALLLASVFYFRRVERRFADVVITDHDDSTCLYRRRLGKAISAWTASEGIYDIPRGDGRAGGRPLRRFRHLSGTDAKPKDLGLARRELRRAPGEAVGIIAAIGAGKSTLLKILPASPSRPWAGPRSAGEWAACWRWAPDSIPN